LGGVVECRVRQLPAGLGEPFFDPLESLISHIVFAIPAIKGIEFGAGFAAARMRGSEMNDNIIDRSGTTATNNAGGINGGISNGNEIVFRIAVKPASSIALKQQTIDLRTGQPAEIQVRGRHDAAIALRVPVVLEAATAIALADALLILKTVNP
jgi:chorismate synthase